MGDVGNKRISREIERSLKAARKEREKRERKLKLCQSLGIDVDRRNKKYPIVPDYDQLSKELSEFRKGYNDYFKQPGILENGEMQSRSTQTFWHVCYLQKKRMNRLGVTMETKCDRRDYRKGHRRAFGGPIYQDKYSDGRYEMNNVREEITATKRFVKGGAVIGKYEYEEAASYFVLSTQSLGDNRIVCPNCGAATTKEDLIDGCDYCGTKITIEDLQDKIGHFSFNEDSEIRYLKEHGTELALQGPNTVYKLDRYFNDKQGNELREHDPNFSLFDFFTNVHNKIAMIHFADDQNQVNAFSLMNLEEAMKLHKNVVDLEIYSTRIDSYSNKYHPYEVKDGLQYIRTTSYMYYYELVDGKVEKKHQNIEIELVKSADCKTQSVHAPSLMKCEGCGNSLSLLDGKACPICGREINLYEKDWVITRYRVLSGTDRTEFQ